MQFLVGGNPNEYRRIRHQLNVTNAPFNAAVFSLHLSIKIVYDLSTHNAISSINCGEGSINFTPTTVLLGNGQGSGLLICLGGRFYRQTSPALVVLFYKFLNWAPNVAGGLVATNFVNVPASGIVNSISNPDFFATGSIMQLDFRLGNSGNGNYNTYCGIDNWRVEIIPASSAFGLARIGGLVALRCRHQLGLALALQLRLTRRSCARSVGHAQRVSIIATTNLLHAATHARFFVDPTKMPKPTRLESHA